MNTRPDSPNESPTTEPLVDAVVGLSHRIDGTELACLRGIVSNVAQSLCKDGRYPSDDGELAHFKRAIRMLAPMQGHPHMPINGVCYLGRPEFMTDERLETLRQEAIDIRAERAIQQRGHLVGVGGTLGDELANSAEMHALVSAHTEAVSATGVVSYMYYEGEGAGLCAHVDTDVFSINVNIMLEHGGSTQDSHLFVFTVDGENREEIRHDPGEIVITYGDSIVHGRAPLAAGETVTLLTVGFQPAAWEGQAR